MTQKCLQMEMWSFMIQVIQTKIVFVATMRMMRGTWIVFVAMMKPTHHTVSSVSSHWSHATSWKPRWSPKFSNDSDDDHHSDEEDRQWYWQG